MQRRFARTRSRAVVTVVRIAGAVVCAGLLAACVFGGNGPPTFGAPQGDGGDAAADARDGGDAPTETGHADASDATGAGGEGAADDAGDAAAQGPPMASFSATAIDFGPVGCGAAAAMSTLTISNSGQTPLAVSASLVGTAFAVSPTSLVVMPGTPGTLTLTATVQQSATAGTAIVGSLALFTNDPNDANRVLPLSATPSGAIVTGLNLYALPSSEIGLPSAPTPITITNGGNALVVLGVNAPMDSRFAIKGIAPGAVEGVSLAA